MDKVCLRKDERYTELLRGLRELYIESVLELENYGWRCCGKSKVKI